MCVRVHSWKKDERLRMESLGFLVADTLQLDFNDTVKVFATRDPRERFRLLLDFLAPIRSELAAMKTLDAIGIESEVLPTEEGAAAATTRVGSSLGLAPGLKVEYWYNEEWGWCTGTLVRCKTTRIAGEDITNWTFKYDSDGSEQELRLTLENKARWRVLRKP